MLYPKLKSVEVDGRRMVLFSYHDWFFPAFLLVVSICLLCQHVLGRHPMSHCGLAALLVCLAFLSAFLYERSAFAFDLTARTVLWKRTQFGKTSSGVNKIGSVEDLVMESIGRGRFRLALKFEGETIPLTRSYFGGTIVQPLYKGIVEALNAGH